MTQQREWMVFSNGWKNPNHPDLYLVGSNQSVTAVMRTIKRARHRAGRVGVFPRLDLAMRQSAFA